MLGDITSICIISAGLLSQRRDTVSLLPVQYKTVSPVGNRVFVKVDNEEATSAGGILLPTSAQKKPTQGEVVSLGDAKSLKVRLTMPESSSSASAAVTVAEL